MKIMKKLSILLISLLFALLLISCTANREDNLFQYKVVIPSNADSQICYAADNFICTVYELTGIKLGIVTDIEPESEYEILVGETNRKESKTDTPLGENEYLLFRRGNKLVCKGTGIYIGASLSRLANECLEEKNNITLINGVKKKERAYAYTPSKQCESVIFMIGDGMGQNHIALAEKNGLSEFIAKQFPNKGLSITRSQSVIDKKAAYTDSAASGTAMATGFKTINGYIGLDKDGNRIQNVRELAHSLGYKTGVITTDVITGATPSAFMCHNISRENTAELQAEIDALIENNGIDICKGDIGDELMEETKNALYQLSEDGSNFFLMIEEAQIDKASHANNIDDTIRYVIRYNEAISYATQFALMHPSTALIVTADHETGNLTSNRFVEKGYKFTSYNHTNVNVPIFAIGLGTEAFNNTDVENTALADYVFGIIKKN